MHRFFIPAENITGERLIIAGEQVHQIRNVLRMSSGDFITVLDNSGYEYNVRIDKVTRAEVKGTITEKSKVETEPEVEVVLYQSLAKRDKFEYILQKCTEVGVSCFVPLVANRTVVRDTGRITARRMSRWRRIIREAAEQSERGMLPMLVDAVEMKEAVEDTGKYDKVLFGSSRDEGTDLRSVLGGLASEGKSRIAFFVGPEGGFSDEEKVILRQAGAVLMNMGPRILRMETAAIVGTALILYEAGQMQPKETESKR